MNVREYMNRRCVCGALRSAHAHFDRYETTPSGARKTGQFSVLAVSRASCTGFVDEIELELRGNPALNPLLSPLVVEQQKAHG